MLGAGITAYLTLNHYFDGQIACLGSGGCEAVQQSRYSSLFGLPVAVLGLGYYLTVLAIGALARFGPAPWSNVLAPAYFILSLTAALFSWYLTWLQASVIRSFCVWCLASAACATLLLALSGALAWRWLRA